MRWAIVIDDTSQRDATELDDEAERLAEALLGLFPEPAVADDLEDEATPSLTAGLFDNAKVTVSAGADVSDPLAGASTEPVIVSRRADTDDEVDTDTDTDIDDADTAADTAADTDIDDAADIDLDDESEIDDDIEIVTDDESPAGLFDEVREAASPSFTGVFTAEEPARSEERATPPSVLFRVEDDDEADDVAPLVAAPIFGESTHRSPVVEFVPPPHVDEGEAQRRRAMLIGGSILGVLLLVALIGLLVTSFTGGDGNVVETDTDVSTPSGDVEITPPTTVTTEAPTTEAPTTTVAPTTTAAPTTVAESTTIPSTTVAPATTAAPATTRRPATTQRPATTAAPTTAAPTTAAPTTAAPTTAAPTTAAPTTAAPTTAPAPTWSIDEG